MRYKDSEDTISPRQKVYSYAFKKKVVEEVESGLITKTYARRKYNIGGKSTVLGWCRRYGKFHKKEDKLMAKIKNKDSDIQNNKDKEKIKELESALADAHLKLYAHEKMLEIAKRDFGFDIRKKLGSKLPKK